jgi:hypothetical protein
MISSDLHGAEEPIRWLLGWQRQDNVETNPCMKKKMDVLIQDTLAETSLGGSPAVDEMMVLMDRTPPGQAGRFLEDVAVCWDHLARVAGCRSPRRGNVLPFGC